MFVPVHALFQKVVWPVVWEDLERILLREVHDPGTLIHLVALDGIFSYAIA